LFKVTLEAPEKVTVPDADADPEPEPTATEVGISLIKPVAALV
jgi:hypothetical protein